MYRIAYSIIDRTRDGRVKSCRFGIRDAVYNCEESAKNELIRRYLALTKRKGTYNSIMFTEEEEITDFSDKISPIFLIEDELYIDNENKDTGEVRSFSYLIMEEGEGLDIKHDFEGVEK